jgi:hypothetical protein
LLSEYQQHVLDPTCILDAENLVALLVIAMTTELFHPDTYTEEGMTAQDSFYTSTIRGAAWKLVQVLNDSYEFSWKLGPDAVVALHPFKDVFRHVLGVQMNIICGLWQEFTEKTDQESLSSPLYAAVEQVGLMHDKIMEGYEADYDSDEIWALRALHYELVNVVPVQPSPPAGKCCPNFKRLRPLIPSVTESLDHWQLMRKGATPSLIQLLKGLNSDDF